MTTASMNSINCLQTMVKADSPAILMQFVIDHEALIREKNLVPEISFPEKTINILGDEAFINRMLTNLLNNILKYGKNGFRIELVEKPDELVSIVLVYILLSCWLKSKMPV